MQIYLMLHTLVCDLKNITVILIGILYHETLYEILISLQLYIGSPNHYDCGFELLCKHFLNEALKFTAKLNG